MNPTLVWSIAKCDPPTVSVLVTCVQDILCNNAHDRLWMRASTVSVSFPDPPPKRKGGSGRAAPIGWA